MLYVERGERHFMREMRNEKIRKGRVGKKIENCEETVN
jgi:hypothetical protein